MYALGTIVTPHLIHYLENGKMFRLTKIFNIPSGNIQYVQIKTAVDKEFRCINFDFTSSVDNMYIRCIRSPSLTDGTTEIPCFNLNEYSTNTAQVKFYQDPTGISGGTQISEFHIPGTVGFILSPTGGTYIDVLEKIYKDNTDYILELDNQSADDCVMSVKFDFIERDTNGYT